MRITIDRVHEKYLQTLGTEMDASPREVVNFLLWKMRESNYTFGGQLPLQSPVNGNRFNNPYFDPNTFESTPKTNTVGFVPQSPQAIQEFEDLVEEIDPIIERFISLGVCNEF